MNLIKIAMENKTQTITGTNMTANNKLNFGIAEAIRTIAGVEKFAKGEVSLILNFSSDDFEGYIYENKGLSVFVEWVPRKGGYIEQIIVNNEEEDKVSPIEVMKALILTDLAVDKSGLRIRVLKLANQEFITEGSEEAKELEEVVNVYKQLFDSGVYTPVETEFVDEMTTLPEVPLLADMGLVEREIPETAETVVEEEGEVEVTAEQETTTGDVEQDELDVQEVSQRLRNLLDAGVKLKDFSEVAGVSMNTVSKVKNLDTLKFSQKTLVKMSEAINSEEFNAFRPVGAVIEEQEEVKAESKQVSLEEKHQEKASASKPVTNGDKFVIAEATEQDVRSKRPNYFKDEWVKDFLIKNNVDGKIVEATLSYRKKQRAELPYDLALLVAPEAVFIQNDRELSRAIGSILQGKHLVIKGPAGTGKTTMVNTLSAILNYPLYTIDGRGDVTSDSFVGYRTKENDELVYVPGRLLRAMQHGAILYIDEANMVDPNVLSAMNPATDDRKEVNPDYAGIVKALPDFRAIYAYNENYEGTRKMNRATMNRAVAIELDYMSVERLKKFLHEYDGNYTEFQKEVLGMGQVHRRTLVTIGNIFEALKMGVTDEILPIEVLSIRNYLDLMEQTYLLTIEDALKNTIEKFDSEVRGEILTILANVEGLDISPEDIIQAV